MIAWFVRNPVAANLLMFAILGWGVFVLWSRSIPVEFFPRAGLETIRIQVSYQGSSPEEVEQAITEPIEFAIFDLQGIDEMVSYSGEDGARIVVTVKRRADEQELMATIERRIAAISNHLPAGAERARISLDDKDDNVITVVLKGDLPEPVLREMILEVRDKLLRLEGVTTMRLKGLRDPEISIEIDPAILEQYGLSLQQVAEKIRSESLNLSAGSLRAQAGEILLRTESQAWDKEQFLSLPLIESDSGTILTVADVATVNEGFAQETRWVYFDGLPAMMIVVERVEGQNMTAIAEQVKEFLAEHEQTLPAGVELAWWEDRTSGLQERIQLLTQSAIWGAGLVLLLLALFLRLSVAFWVMLGIPIAIIGGLAVMPVLGTTINIMSLFAFILVLGIVVDDAIVTGESVYRRLRLGGDPQLAAIAGTKRVALPVTFGVLTTMVAFLPLAFLPGWRGDIFKQLPFVIVPVLAFSLVESKFLLPAHLAKLKLQKRTSFWNPIDLVQQSVSRGLRFFVRKVYLPVLRFTVRWRYAAVIVFFLVFQLSVAVITGRKLPWTFFQMPASTRIHAEVMLKPGLSEVQAKEAMLAIARSAEILQETYVDKVSDVALIKHVSWSLGGSRNKDVANVGHFTLELTPQDKLPASWRKDPKYSVAGITQQWRKQVADLPDVLELSFWSGWGGSNPTIQLHLFSSSREYLAEATSRVRQYLTNTEQFYDINSGEEVGRLEFIFELTEQGRILGISERELAQQLRAAIFGLEAQRFQRGADQVKVWVRFPKEQRQSITILEEMTVVLEGGRRVPLQEVASWRQQRSPTTIERIDRQRQNSVTANADVEQVDVEGQKQALRDKLPQMLSDLPGLEWKLSGDDRDQAETFAALWKGVIVVVALIYLLLAVPLKSYVQPFIVMSVMPFSFAGAVYGHLLMDWLRELSEGPPVLLTIMSVFGMLALVGVVVNDSLVMVDSINQARRKNTTLSWAVFRAGAMRFRPILLTTLTTFFGLLPLLLDQSRTGQTLAPMAISLGFGIVFTTLVTLFFVPVLYWLIEDMKAGLRWIYQRK